jgi:hypothetical protein
MWKLLLKSINYSPFGNSDDAFSGESADRGLGLMVIIAEGLISFFLQVLRYLVRSSPKR